MSDRFSLNDIVSLVDKAGRYVVVSVSDDGRLLVAHSFAEKDNTFVCLQKNVINHWKWQKPV